MSSRLNLSTAQPSCFSLPVGLEGNHGIPPLLRKNHTAGESLFGVQGTSRRQTGGCMHHLPDEACLPDGCSVLSLSRSLFAHMLLSAQERRRMLVGGRVESCLISCIMEKYMCRKHPLSAGSSLSARLISRCSIVLSPCGSRIKIAHRGGCVYRPSVKGRVEAIVQIIQAKTKPNKIKPSTVEKNRRRSPNGTAPFSTLFKFTSSAYIFTFLT